ncbi:hypothetical protein PUNNY_28 [Escherichia phage_vB_EcoD_Punny]|nr:hypothetical protein PUNNY_28 [Escherichia phage_vB_EcoD_Punny]
MLHAIKKPRIAGFVNDNEKSMKQIHRKVLVA